MRKVILLTLFLCLIVFLISCSPLSNKVKEPVSVGSLAITVPIPEEFLKKASLQSITDEIFPSRIEVILSSEEYKSIGKSKSFSEIGEDASVTFQFDAVFPGQWTVTVTIYEEVENPDLPGTTLEYAVYQNSQTVQVSQGETTMSDIKLVPTTGGVTFILKAPFPLEITSGKVTLIDPMPVEESLKENDKTAYFNFNEDPVTADISGIKANLWNYRIEFFNENEELIEKLEGEVIILPDRTTIVEIEQESLPGSTGTLNVDIKWSMAPDEPTGLSAVYNEDPDNPAVTLTWDANVEEDIAGYLVYRSKSSDSEDGTRRLLKDEIETTTTFVDEDAELSKTYYYWLRAYNDDGLASDLSQPTNATVYSTTISAPTGLILKANWTACDSGGPFKVRISWDENTESDIVGYEVFRSQGIEGLKEKVSSGLLRETSFYELFAREPSEEYYYWVRAVKNDGITGPFSEPEKLIRKPFYEVYPPEINAELVNNGLAVELEWESAGDVEYLFDLCGGYIKIFKEEWDVETEEWNWNAEFDVPASGSYIDTEVKPQTAYRYVVMYFFAADDILYEDHGSASVVEISTIENTNQPPVLNSIGNKSIDERALLEFTVTASDPDDEDTITLSADNLPETASFDPESGEFSWTPGYEESGTYNITFTVSDGEMEDSEVVIVSVEDLVLYVPDEYGTIQAAINAADNGDRVIVSSGNYREGLDFLGKDIIVESDGDKENTTIELPDNAESRICFKNNEKRSTVLRGFTILKETGSGSTDGAIEIQGSSPSIENNIIKPYYEKPGMTFAGIIINPPDDSISSASPLIKDNTISNFKGNGIKGYNTNPEITGNVISNNYIGIDIDNYNTDLSSIIINKNIIEENTDYGIRLRKTSAEIGDEFETQYILKNGNTGIHIDSLASGDEITIVNNTIKENKNINTDGGGIYIGGSQGVATISGNIIESNEATNGGGLYFYVTGSTDNTFINNTVKLNTASLEGGGIYIYEDCSLIIGSGLDSDKNTIVYNEANSGGGIYLGGIGNSQINNNDISHNNAVYYGGGFYCQGSVGLDNARILNNTIFNNRAEDGGGCCIYSNAETVLAGNIINDNKAEHQGGGIYSTGSPVIGPENSFDESAKNDIYLNSAETGGGLYIKYISGDGVPAVQNNNINHNYAETNDKDAEGGGIYIKADDFNIINNQIDHNEAIVNTSSQWSFARGGGIYVQGDGTIKANKIELNQSHTLPDDSLTYSQGGGIYVDTYCSPVIESNGIFENKAISGSGKVRGGGIYIGFQSIYPDSLETFKDNNFNFNFIDPDNISNNMGLGIDIYMDASDIRDQIDINIIKNNNTGTFSTDNHVVVVFPE